MMKRRTTILGLATLSILALAGTVLAVPPTDTDRMEKISGIGYYAEPGACIDPEGDGASYALTMTGSLTGCHYTFVETSRCSPGGAYYESGTEVFVGTYNGRHGTFATTYIFTAKYRDCPNFVEEVNGRCQHPIVVGSGTGVFEGIRESRIDMKDDIAAGNFPYRGHLLF